ncbi:MAG: uracil phosphoribosyltransferase [Coraliomargarita sp.]
MLTELRDHPIVAHHITVLRDVETSPQDFRQSATALTRVLMLEASKHLHVDSVRVETPIETTDGAKLSGSVVLVPILRAGLGMLEACLEILPTAAVGYVGLERDEDTAVARCYYSKMPPLEDSEHVFVIDPMLATGGSAVQSVEQLKSLGAKRISMLCIISAPEGIEAVQKAHPDVAVFTTVLDRELNDQKYICPGLGDFGDRLYCT